MIFGIGPKVGRGANKFTAMSQKPPLKLVWRPMVLLVSSLIFFLVSVFFWALIFFGPDSDKTLFNWTLGSIYVFPALYGAVYGFRTRVEATESGVRWRDWRGV